MSYLALSTEQKEHVLNAMPIGVILNITFQDATTLKLTGDDIVADSFSIERTACYNEEFEIGTADTAELIFSIFRTSELDGKVFAGATVMVTYDFDMLNPEISTVSAGYFIIDQEPRSDEIITIRALDYMAKFNKPVSGFVEGMSIDLSTLLDTACVNCGVEYLYDPLYPEPTWTGTVDYDPILDSATWHNIISWLALIAGKTAIINSDGKLIFLTRTVADTIPYELVLSENERGKATTITGVKCEYNDEIFIAGTEENIINIDWNPLIASNAADIVAHLYAVWGGYVYYPVKEIVTVGLPQVGVMEEIFIGIDTIPILATNHIYTVNSNSSMKGAGTKEPVAGYATKSFSDSELGILRKVSSQLDTITEERIKNNYSDAVLNLNREVTNALGYYTTPFQYGNKTLMYRHDQPLLEESMYIEYIPEAGTRVWTATGWNGGNPTWENGYTKDGSLVARTISAAKISGEQIIAGTLTADKISVGVDKSLESALSEQTELNNSASSKLTYITTNETGDLELGKTGNDVKLTLSNAELGFTDMGEKVAWFTDNKLYVNQLQAKETILLGQYQFQIRDDGSFILVWV